MRIREERPILRQGEGGACGRTALRIGKTRSCRPLAVDPKKVVSASQKNGRSDLPEAEFNGGVEPVALDLEALGTEHGAELENRFGPFDRFEGVDRPIHRLTRSPRGTLELQPADGSAALRIQFRRTSGGQPSPLVRAIGIRSGVETVFDATAGLGRDAWEVLSAGSARVTLCERAGWLAAMLDDALQGAGAELAQRAPVVRGEARAVLAALAPEARPDAVYLDPMFSPRGKQSLPKREIQLLRALSPSPTPAEEAELLEIARSVARRRVVVKRHPKAPPLGTVAPTGTVQGRLIRFDVYAPAGS